MGAWLSISLRALLLLAVSVSWIRLFFGPRAAVRVNGFVQCSARHAGLVAHLRDTLALVQQCLCPLCHLRRQHVRRATPRLLEETCGSMLPMHLHVSLHSCQRHSEGPYDVALPHRPIGNQLAGNHPEALHIFLFMLKHWQQAVEINYSSVLLLERQVLGDGGQAVRKDRQLELRHGLVSPIAPNHATLPTDATRGQVIFLDSLKTTG